MSGSLLAQVEKDLKRWDPFLPAGVSILPTRTQSLPTPNRPQRVALAHPARFLVNRWGRRTGKSLGGLLKLYASARKKPGGLFWWVWPTLKAGRKFGWKQFVTRYLAGRATLLEGDMAAVLPNGARIEVVGADREHAHNLRGAAVDGAVLEECRNMLRFVWSEIVRPALLSTRGWCWFNSTPRGRDWFYKIDCFARTAKARARGWAALHFTSYDNERIDPREIDDLKADLTEREITQEIEAGFLTDGGTVFDNVESQCMATPESPGGGRYVMGIDFGRQTDPTVVSVVDQKTRRQVFIESWTKVDFERQENRILGLIGDWNPIVVIPEYNSFGGPLCERFEYQHGVPLFPQHDDKPSGFYTTNESKAELVRTLMLGLGRKEWTLLDDDTLKGELVSFEETRTKAGGRRFAAPEGLHDDYAMATMLSVWGAENYVEAFVCG